MERIVINLDAPAYERWLCLEPYRNEITVLIHTYLADLEDASFFETIIDYYKAECIDATYVEELRGIASFTGFTIDNLLIANLYYDALKLVFGCTAFSVPTEKGNLHARNLDWWSDNNSLRDYSKIFDFERNGKVVFSSVGWPGFIGVFSGMKPGKFAITLNAVMSQESPELAPPITFKIRDVLEKMDSFEDATRVLSQDSVASDSLLLVTGTQEGERLVIERTPNRASFRRPDGKNNLVVTNGYQEMTNKGILGDLLQETSCGRQNRALQLLSLQKPENTEACFDILNDDEIRMDITMQQMVFAVDEGKIYVR
ncbi:C45 family autoproteolytic acyltransferase/hydrolase [Aureisphaera galaxeae]|nr:C45 family autoproteolytic acyltransferase/hydrolase [Aureisphaera galaxeae]